MVVDHQLCAHVLDLHIGSRCGRPIAQPMPPNYAIAVQIWSTWELATSKLYVDPKYIAEADEDEFALAFARIEWFDV